MNTRIEKIIKTHWQQMVEGTNFYRGMSLHDLNLKSEIILDPDKNPLKKIAPLLIEYSEFLLHLITKGLEFNVNDFYVEPLQKILNWTIRDIKNPGIDSTTNYADAAAYAFNYAGSQVKHNFNIIANTIDKCKNQRCFSVPERKRFLQMTQQVQKLMLVESNIKHQSTVIKVKRSCEAFQDNSVEKLNFGSYPFFFERVVNGAKASGSLTVDKIAFFLHKKSQTNNFNMRLVKLLYHNDIEEIINITHDIF